MAIVDIKVPSPGESISEVRIARWLVKEGDVVSKDQVLGEIDSDKATLELSAEAEGKVQLLAKEDQTVQTHNRISAGKPMNRWERIHNSFGSWVRRRQCNRESGRTGFY